MYIVRYGRGYPESEAPGRSRIVSIWTSPLERDRGGSVTETTKATRWVALAESFYVAIWLAHRPFWRDSTVEAEFGDDVVRTRHLRSNRHRCGGDGVGGGGVLHGVCGPRLRTVQQD